MLKKVFLSVLLMTICFSPYVSYAGQTNVVLGWDSYSKATTPDLDKINIYKRVYPDGSYNFNAGGIAASVSQTFDASGKSIPVQVSIPVEYADNAVTKYAFVARAFDKSGNQSANSNEVIWSINTTPQPNTVIPQIKDLTAVYNKNTKAIDCNWTQESIDQVTHWVVYMKEPGGKYTQAAKIDWNKKDTEITANILQDIPDGVISVYDMVVVGFNSISKKHSENSNAVRITIDKESPTKTINLHLIAQ